MNVRLCGSKILLGAPKRLPLAHARAHGFNVRPSNGTCFFEAPRTQRAQRKRHRGNQKRRTAPHRGFLCESLCALCGESSYTHFGAIGPIEGRTRDAIPPTGGGFEPPRKQRARRKRHRGNQKRRDAPRVDVVRRPRSVVYPCPSVSIRVKGSRAPRAEFHRRGTVNGGI